MRKLVISLLVLMAATGCAGTKKTVTKKRAISPSVSVEAEYPSSWYLTATGIGQTEREARRLAVSELSNIFESKVTSDVTNSVKSVMGSGSGERVSRTARQSVRVVSELKLKGVKIGKTWFDERQKSHFAVAVLDRFQAKENWSREIADVDGRAEALLESVKAQKSGFTRLQTLKKVRRLWLEREVTASRLRVLGFHDASKPTYEIRRIFGKMQEIKTGLRIFINTGEGKYAKMASSEITEMLGKEGFVLTKQKSRANILISGKVSVEPVSLPGSDWEFARARAALSIIDAVTGLTVGEVTENKRAGHLQYQEAANKAIKKVSKSAYQKLVAYFSE